MTDFNILNAPILTILDTVMMTLMANINLTWQNLAINNTRTHCMLIRLLLAYMHAYSLYMHTDVVLKVGALMFTTYYWEV